MRGAHQGVPVASLPGASGGGGLFSGLFGNGARPAPVQPVAITTRAATTGTGGLDGWLLNGLFGRR
jgi:hypothetical protein